MSYCNYNVGDLGPIGVNNMPEGVIFHVDTSNPAITRFWEVELGDIVQGYLDPPFDGFIGDEPFQAPTPPNFPGVIGIGSNPAYGPCKVSMHGGAEWGYFGMNVTPIFGASQASQQAGFGKERSFMDYIYTWLPPANGGMPSPPPATWNVSPLPGVAGAHSYNFNFNPVDLSNNTIAQFMYVSMPATTTTQLPSASGGGYAQYPHLQPNWSCIGVTPQNTGLASSECWFLPSMDTLRKVNDSINQFSALHNVQHPFNQPDFVPLYGTYWTASFKNAAPTGTQLQLHEGAWAAEIEQPNLDFVFRPRCHTYSVRRVRYWDCPSSTPADDRKYNYRDGSYKHFNKQEVFGINQGTGITFTHNEIYQGFTGPGTAGSSGARPFKEITLMQNAGNSWAAQFSYFPPPSWGFNPFTNWANMQALGQVGFKQTDSVIGFDLFTMILNGTDVLGNVIFDSNNYINFHQNHPGPYIISIYDDNKQFLGKWQYDRIVALAERYAHNWPGLTAAPGHTHLHNNLLDQNMALRIVFEGVTHLDCPHGNVVNYANVDSRWDIFRNQMGVVDMTIPHPYFEGQETVTQPQNNVPYTGKENARVTNSGAYIRFECPTINNFESIDNGPNTTPGRPNVVCIPNGSYQLFPPTTSAPYYSAHVRIAKGLIGTNFLQWHGCTGTNSHVGENLAYNYPQPNFFTWTGWGNGVINACSPDYGGTHFLWNWWGSNPPTNPNMTWFSDLATGYSKCRGDLHTVPMNNSLTGINNLT